MNRIRSIVLFASLLAVGLWLAACNAAPLPPLLATVAPGTGEQLSGPTVQPAAPQPVAAAGEATATPAITATQPATATAAVPTKVAPVVAVEPTMPVTPTVEPTVTPPAVEPTATPTARKQVAAKPTARPTRAARATVAPAPTRAPARPTATRVRPTPTPEWPKTLAITEQQLEQQAGSVPGLQVTGLDVTFADNSMTLSAASLRYSIVSIRNLTVEGHFTASNCDVTFVADRIQPRNLATSAIPNIVNQTLDQQLGQWCVESIAITPGQLVATVRPR